MRTSTAVRSDRSAVSVHRSAAAAVAALALLGALLLPVPDAHATAYRFWSYWVAPAGAWSFSTQGAARVPRDGDVEGWRFAVSEATGSSTPPRFQPDFASICADTAPVAGKKRVGVVVDFGAAADAPPGQVPPAGPVAVCVVAASDANGYEVLDAVTTLRVDTGLVCGIGGYPATGCGDPVADDPGPGPGPGTGSGAGQGSGGASTEDPDRGSGGDQPPDPGATADSGGSGQDPDPRSTPAGEVEPSAGEPSPGAPAPSSPGTPVLAAPQAGAAGEPAAPLGLLVGLLVVVGLGLGAVVVSRRRP